MSPAAGAFPGIDDPLAFVRKALNDGLRRMGTTHLEPVDMEDAFSFLCVELVDSLRKFKPEIGPSFSTYAYRRLSFYGCVNWYRANRGDSRYGTWVGGTRGCRHERLQDDSCKCGSRYVRNGGREQVSGDAAMFVNTTTVDTPEIRALIDELDHDRLSPGVRATLRHIVLPMEEEGLTAEEVAVRLGRSKRDVNRDLERLREEMTA